VRDVPVFGLVITNVSVELTFAAVGLGEKDFAIEGGATTVTTFVLELLVSSSSVMLPFGSTVAVLDKLPAAVGVTANVTLNDAPVGNVTAPFATQLRAVPDIEQLINPVGAVPPLVTVNAPCG